MRLYTGYYAMAKKYQNAGYFTIGISLTARFYDGSMYGRLAPKREFMHLTDNEYTIKFNDQLNKINLKEIWDRLLELSGRAEKVVLLCHEKEGEFCHRHLVARWIEKELMTRFPGRKFTIPELGNMKPAKAEPPPDTQKKMF